MTWRSFFFAFVGLAASAALIYFSKPIAVFLLSSFGIETEKRTPQVAEVITTEGKAFVRQSGHGSFSKLTANMLIHQSDEIKTENRSRIHLKFESGYEIEILEESQAILDIWSNQTDRRPDYISFLRGDFRLLQKGTPGELYIVLDDEVFAPESKPEKSEKNFKISTEQNEPARSQRQSPTTESLPESAAKPSSMPDKVSKKGAETLSSAYIESVFMSRAALFRRCQLTSLRDNKMANGNMLFSLVITPKGRVQKVKLLQKSFENLSLENCVSSVIERTKFKAFQGRAISLSYPLNFQ